MDAFSNDDTYKIHPDGPGLTRLTESPGEEWWPSWSRDGPKIAYTQPIT